jgi:hypothetical protein
MTRRVDTRFVSVEEDEDALHIRRRGLPWGLLPLVTVGAAVLGLGFRVDHPLGMLAPLAFLAMPFAVVRWVLDRERRRFGDCVARGVTVAKRASSSGYRDGSLAASVVVDGRGYEAAQVRGVGVEQAVLRRDADSPDAEVRRSYTVVMYLEGPRAVDVFDSRDKAAATALAEKITAALALPAPRMHDRRQTMPIPVGAAVALGALWVFAAMLAGIASLGVRGPAAGVSDWLTIATWVAAYALFLTVSASALVRRSLARVERSEPHTRT